MAEIKKLTEKEFNDIASRFRFKPETLGKDYYLTLILFLIKDVEGIYFKGGTALQKIFLHHTRLSEDIDFTITRDAKKIQSEILKILEPTGFFKKITEDKNLEGFLRMVVHYNGFMGEKETVFIDLNKRASMLLKPEEHTIEHFYEGHILPFSIKTLAVEEMIAEKLKATMTRNKPRDHFDIYKIIEANFTINLTLVEKKCKESEKEFSVIRMFKNAQKLKNQWEPDLMPLLTKEVSFQTVIKALAHHFKLKEEKEQRKKAKEKH
ncbi:MAG: nucleotidyl transferase AbiEii/AbiGii toxin family protein [Nanoarchaeota archaeon]|nr:nucleotidyl transferase AbiEii/AbiGii toxin family protein [Nanoarchaeota archaeon]